VCLDEGGWRALRAAGELIEEAIEGAN